MPPIPFNKVKWWVLQKQRPTAEFKRSFSGMASSQLRSEEMFACPVWQVERSCRCASRLTEVCCIGLLCIYDRGCQKQSHWRRCVPSRVVQSGLWGVQVLGEWSQKVWFDDVFWSYGCNCRTICNFEMSYAVYQDCHQPRTPAHGFLNACRGFPILST